MLIVYRWLGLRLHLMNGVFSKGRQLRELRNKQIQGCILYSDHKLKKRELFKFKHDDDDEIYTFVSFEDKKDILKRNRFLIEGQIWLKKQLIDRHSILYIKAAGPVLTRFNAPGITNILTKKNVVAMCYRLEVALKWREPIPFRKEWLKKVKK